MLINPEGQPIRDDISVPEMTERQRQDAEDRTSVKAVVVYEAIRQDGDEELQRQPSALAWSGLAAGLSMGFSFVSEALLRTWLPDAPWRHLIVPLGYPVGFLIVIIGRQQLFTENTLTAIIPLLTRRTWATAAAVVRLWAIVLASNLAGAHIFAWVISNTPVFRPEVQASLRSLALEAADVSFGNAVIRGVFAGWLIATVVWMNAATNTSRTPIIIILTYLVGVAGLTHVVAGSIEVLFLVWTGQRSWFSYIDGYMLPTLIGNILGGVSLVSALNHAQVVSGQDLRKTNLTS